MILNNELNKNKIIKNNKNKDIKNNKNINKKLFNSFLFNLFIVVLEIVGLVLSIQRHGINVFIFYTEISNYFTLIISFIFLIVIFKKQEIPNLFIFLRFACTVCLTITLIVSFGVITPFKPSLWKYMLYQGSSLYFHLLCPILSFISFVFFEYNIKLPKISIIYSLIPTFVYSTILIILNLVKVIEGPYPFFFFYKLPLYISLLSLAGVVVICFSVAIGIYSSLYIKEKVYQHKLK